MSPALIFLVLSSLGPFLPLPYLLPPVVLSDLLLPLHVSRPVPSRPAPSFPAEGRDGGRGRGVHHALRRGRRALAAPKLRRPRRHQPALGLPPGPGGGAELARPAGVPAARSGGERRLGALRKPRPVEGAADEVGAEHVPRDGGCGAEVAQVPPERVSGGSRKEGKRGGQGGPATQEGVSDA